MAKEPIKYESALPALLQSLIPQTEKNTTTGTANTGPLEQIFGQQQASSTPEGMAALITQLFQQGAQAVPALTGAYANATGSRSSNNSGLALSLAELNKTIAGQAAGLVGEQQARAAQTAGAIANATRGTSTTATRGADPTTSLLTGLGGTALNWADKNKLFDPLKSGVKDLFSPAATAAVDYAGSNALDGFLALNDNFSAAAGPSLVESNLFDFAAPSVGYDMADIGSSLLTDTISADYGSEALDTGGSLLEDAGDWISSFFADGGYVDAKKFQAKAASVKQSYADGGIVRNKNQMGKPVQQQGRLAKNYAGYAQPSAASGPTTTSAVLTDRTAPSGGNVDMSVNTGFGTPEQNASMLGSFGLSALGFASPLAALAVGALTDTKSFQSVLARTLTDQLGITNSLGKSMAGPGQADPGVKAGTQDALTGFLALNDNFGTSSGASNDGLGAAGMGDAGPNGSSGDAAGVGGSAASGPGDGASDSLADGGPVDGMGTGISDSIDAKLSDGEFVTSADVVAQPGVRQLLEALQAQFHTPAAMQKMQGKR